MQESEKLLQNKQGNVEAIFLEHFLKDWSATNTARLAVQPQKIVRDPEGVLHENWSNLSEVIKADTLFVQCLVINQYLSIQQAFQRLLAIKQVLHKLSPYYEDGDLTASWQGLLANQQQELITDLNIRKYVSHHPESSYQEAFNYSQSLLKQKTMTTPSMVELRWYYLKDSLDSWVDWQRAKMHWLNPYQILNAVMAQYGRPFPYEVFQQQVDIANFPNIRFLDEAALLWKQLQPADTLQSVVKNGTFSFSLLENEYIDALSKSYQRQKIIDQLFSQEEMLTNSQAIYFNGIAFKNAAGKLLTDFINCTELEKIPDYQVSSPAQRRRLLQEKFYQIGESEYYKIGTLLHSLESSLQRIYYYQFLELPLYNNSQTKLLNLFKQSEEQWKKHKNYPIQPRLLLALHLAESNNVTFSDPDWKVNIKQLFNYLEKEVEKIFLNPPQFDRVKAAMAVLQAQGMALQEIKQERFYTITGDNANLSVSYFGTPLEQFLKIADWDGVIGKVMHYKEKKLSRKKRYNKQKNVSMLTYIKIPGLKIRPSII